MEIVIPLLFKMAIIVDSVTIIPEGRKEREPKIKEVKYICPERIIPKSIFNEIKINKLQ